MDPHPSVAGTRTALLARIAAAARGADRAPADITLTAVSKQQPDDRIEAALVSGQRVFGENRVQEAQGRWGARDRTGLELRLIGPLQTNKAREAVALFDVIETLDRPKLAAALAAAMQAEGRRPRLLAQVNTGEEPQKAGVAPGALADLLAACASEGLRIEGLMCIPPAAEPAGPHFALLARLAARHNLPTLSMGMSEDFETAIRFGATHVRIGSAFFGARA
jgi:pyridoxal phosphate enzyme (YggS family)